MSPSRLGQRIHVPSHQSAQQPLLLCLCMVQDRAPSHESGHISGHETLQTSPLPPALENPQEKLLVSPALLPWLFLLQRTLQQRFPSPLELCLLPAPLPGGPSTALQTATSPAGAQGRVATSGAEVTAGAGGWKALRCRLFPSGAANWLLITGAPVPAGCRTWTHGPRGAGRGRG